MQAHTVSLLIIVFCIVMSAYFSATETAFSSLNRIKMKNMAEKGNQRAALVLQLSESYDTLLSTILIGNNIVNIASASLATVLFVRLLGEESGPSISTLVTTVVVLIFGEISPKSIAKESPEQFAMFSAPLLRVFVICLTPLNFLFRQWKRLLSAVFKTKEDTSITEEELLTIVDEARQGGGIGEQEGALIRNAIEFSELEACEIMTPRPDIVGVRTDATKREAAVVFSNSGFSRLPVYRGDMDHIVGVLYQKDLVRCMEDAGATPASLARPALFCTKKQKIGTLLSKLQQGKLHIAVVVDEFGGTAGIVTLEDILEEIVGEIWDEHDRVVQQIEQPAPGVYLVRGGANVEDVFEHLGREREFDAVTVSGWVMEALGRMPVQGDQFEFEGLHVTVEQVAGRRVEQVRIEAGKSQAGESAGK